MDKNRELSAFEKASLKAAEDLAGFKDAFRIAKDRREAQGMQEDKIMTPIKADKAKELVIENIAASMSHIWNAIDVECSKNGTMIKVKLTDDEEWVLEQMGYRLEYCCDHHEHMVWWG